MVLTTDLLAESECTILLFLFTELLQKRKGAETEIIKRHTNPILANDSSNQL